jgi:hypothetical protein
MSSPSERLSRRQRARTPLAFARHLIGLVRERHGCTRVAALWVQRDSVYKALLGHAFCWDQDRDARNYDGPWPVICHPPCGPWGVFAWKCKKTRLDGVCAMEIVHRVGGVIEQPRGSQLFREFGRGGEVLRLNQSEYGFPAPKPTLLYMPTKETE